MKDEAERRVSPMETWILSELAKVTPPVGQAHPGIQCQVVFAIGAAASGSLRATDTPGIFQMIVEAKDHSGASRMMDRYFAAEAVFMLDVPRALPMIQPVGGRILSPLG
jgi:hypothetical protein